MGTERPLPFLAIYVSFPGIADDGVHRRGHVQQISVMAYLYAVQAVLVPSRIGYCALASSLRSSATSSNERKRARWSWIWLAIMSSSADVCWLN